MRLLSEDTVGIMNIYAEARGEPFIGKCGVGEVTRERARLHYASNGTIFGTVFRKGQFSWTDPRDPNFLLALSIDDDSPVVQECIEAWLASASSHYTFGAVLYLNPTIVTHMPTWANPEKRTAIIGAHHFFMD